MGDVVKFGSGKAVPIRVPLYSVILKSLQAAAKNPGSDITQAHVDAYIASGGQTIHSGKKEGGEVRKFDNGGPSFVNDPAFTMKEPTVPQQEESTPSQEGDPSFAQNIIEDIKPYVPPNLAQVGSDIFKTFIKEPLTMDYGVKDTKKETAINTIQQFLYDITPFYGVARASDLTKDSFLDLVDEASQGMYGDALKSTAMTVLFSIGMLPVVGTEAKIVGQAIGRTKSAVRGTSGDKVTPTSKENVSPEAKKAGDVVIDTDGKPKVLNEKGKLQPMPVYESKLEKSFHLTDAPEMASGAQWLEFFKNKGVRETEVRDSGIFDHLTDAAELQKPVTQSELIKLYEQSPGRNMLIKETKKHKDSAMTDFDQAGDPASYKELVFNAGKIKEFPTSGQHYDPNTLAWIRQSDYRTPDHVTMDFDKLSYNNVTLIKEWQSDMSAIAFKSQKELNKLLKNLKAEGTDIASMPTSVFRPYPPSKELSKFKTKTIGKEIDDIQKQVNKFTTRETMDPVALQELLTRQHKLIDNLLSRRDVQRHMAFFEGQGQKGLYSFENFPFKNESDLFYMTLSGAAREAINNGKQYLAIAPSKIVNQRNSKYEISRDEAKIIMDKKAKGKKLTEVEKKKENGLKFFQIYDQKIPEILKKIAKRNGTTAKEIDVVVGKPEYIVKDLEGSTVGRTFKSLKEAREVFPKAGYSEMIRGQEIISPSKEVPDFMITKIDKTEKVFALELNENFMYPQPLYRRQGGLVQSSLKSFNDITRPL